MSAIGTHLNNQGDVALTTNQAQNVRKNGVRKDDVRKDDVRKDDVRKDDVRKDDVRKDSDLDSAIIQLLKEHPNILISSVSEQLGVSYKTVQRAIAILKMSGHIKRVGGRKNGYWVVLNL